MISHKTLGHPATLFGLGIVCFIIGLKGTMLIDDAVKADIAVKGVQVAQPSAAPTPEPSGPLLSGPIVSPDSFVGIWQEEWGGVQSDVWIHNSFVNGVPLVSKPGNWRVGDVRYENGVLSFQAYGGDSDWSFTYWVTYNTSERMTLRVARHHDNAHFDGYLNRTGGVPPEPTESYSSSPPGGVPGGVPGGEVGGVLGGVIGGSQESPARQGPVRVSGGELLGKLLERVDPVYPPMARQARAQGAVVLEVKVDEFGEVASARILSGHPMLTQAGVEAVRQWIFEPTYDANDEPVEVIGTVTVNFNLGSSAAAEPAAAPPQPQAPTSSEVPAPAGLQAFVGTWSAKWADINDPNGITISIVKGQPRVTRTGGWSVSQESFDGRVLSFHTQGGGSNWAFRYYLEYAGPNRLKLRVHRLHDNQSFTGEFTK